jgi:glutamate synthase domain-containing protein 1
VGVYFKDLSDPRCVSALALVHQRFSTNTFPEWPLAHPYRMVAHNGEINTVKGNYNWMRAREGVMNSPVLGADLQKLYPISFAGQSDTATFDNCLELLVAAGTRERLKVVWQARVVCQATHGRGPGQCRHG